MTTGPISPRIPVEPGPRPLPKVDGERGRTEERQSFADLFAVKRAPSAALGAPSAALGARADASAPETSGAVFERLDAAQVFNETGLFRGAAPLSAESVIAARQERAPAVRARPELSAEAALQMSLAPAPGIAPDAGSADPPTAAGQVAIAGGSTPADASRATSREALRAAISLRGQPAPVPQNPAEPPQPAPQAPRSDTVGRTSQRAAMLVQAYLAKAGSAAAQVSVQAVEGEISLVARADKLTREERDRLRIEIGELLARHGLAAETITINGEALLSLRGRDD